MGSATAARITCRMTIVCSAQMPRLVVFALMATILLTIMRISSRLAWIANQGLVKNAQAVTKNPVIFAVKTK